MVPYLERQDDFTSAFRLYFRLYFRLRDKKIIFLNFFKSDELERRSIREKNDIVFISTPW